MIDILASVIGAFIGFAIVWFGVRYYISRKDAPSGHRSPPKDTPSRTVADALAAEHQARLAASIPDSYSADPRADAGADPSLSGIPDLIEPIIGWRCWKVDEDGTLRALHGGGHLAGFGYGPAWEPRKAVVASCNNHYTHMNYDPDRAPHIAPMAHCACGFYAARRPRDIPSVGSGYAYGLVAMWGKVIEHDGGFRSQYAYPINVTLIPGGDWGRKAPASVVLSRIRRLYGVPARLGSKDEYVELCADNLSTEPLPSQIESLIQAQEATA